MPGSDWAAMPSGRSAATSPKVTHTTLIALWATVLERLGELEAEQW